MEKRRRSDNERVAMTRKEQRQKEKNEKIEK